MYGRRSLMSKYPRQEPHEPPHKRAAEAKAGATLPPSLPPRRAAKPPQEPLEPRMVMEVEGDALGGTSTSAPVSARRAEMVDPPGPMMRPCCALGMLSVTLVAPGGGRCDGPAAPAAGLWDWA